MRFAIVFLWVLAACWHVEGGAPANSIRIVNGQEAIPHSIPYQVFLDLVGGEDEWFCGGVLISANYVLTTGQCISKASLANVILGAHNLDIDESSQQIIRVNTFKVIDGFDFYNNINDIGLIRLPFPANITDAVKPIELSTLKAHELVNKTASVSGWGLTDIWGSLSGKLRVANATIVDESLCHEWLHYNSSQQICGNGPVDQRGPCEADYGGPLTFDGKLVGLVSYTECTVTELPDVYTRISYYLDWIKANSDVIVT